MRNYRCESCNKIFTREESASPQSAIWPECPGCGCPCDYDSTIIVTRHRGLVDYLINEGIVKEPVTIIVHATPNNIAGRDVYGILPHHLSCLTRSFTEVPIRIPSELRGKELTEEQVRHYAGEISTYSVKKL